MVLAALPQDTVRLIKSTQVITTPSSIVKELTENSLDALATTISVKMEKFGFQRLEIRDNGSGIHQDDVELIAKPHFTSKISSFSDLASLSSYGFRGEALSSLCAVADMTVTTKRKADTMGHTYTFNHKGEVSSKIPAATPNGTTIVIKNLFKNVPVRHQYYSNSKHCKEELKKIENILLALSLAVPSAHITLTHDRANVFQKNASHNLQGVLMTLFPEIYKKLYSRNKVTDHASIEICLPDKNCRANHDYSRSSTDRLFIFVNKRPVSIKSIEKLVKAYFNQGHESCHGRYPVGFVFLQVSPDEVDVNLEPNKNKVLLSNERLILESLGEMLGELYGTIEPKKNNSKDVNLGLEDTCETLDDVTCTFAGVTQVQNKGNQPISSCSKVSNDNDDFSQRQTQKNKTKVFHESVCHDNLRHLSEENHSIPTISQKNPPILSTNKKVISPEDDLFMDDFSPLKRQKNEAKAIDTSGDSSIDCGQRRSLSLSKLSKACNKTMTTDIAPKVVMNRDSMSLLTPSLESIGRDHCQGANGSSEKIVNVKDNRMASTPSSVTKDIFPDLSLSTIHATGEISNTCAVVSQHSGSSSIGKSASDRPPNMTISSSIENAQRKLDSDGFDIKVNDKPNDHTSSNVHFELDSDGFDIRLNKKSEAHSSSNDSVAMHESLLGSDGIPVYHIPPIELEPMSSSDQDVTHVCINENDKNLISTTGHERPPLNQTSPLNELKDNNNQNSSSIHKDEFDKSLESVIKAPRLALEDAQNITICENISNNREKENIDQQQTRNNQNSFGLTLDADIKIQNTGKENDERLSSKGSEEDGQTSKDIRTNAEPPGNWSRGTMGNGHNIQTVQILKPQNNLSNKDNISAARPEVKRLLDISDLQERAASPPKKKKINSLGSASFDYIHSKPVKKPSTPFILFSRDIRTQVLSENPGADFAFIAKEMADRWKALDNDTKRHYQDMAKEDNVRYQKAIKNIKESRGLNSTFDTSLNEGLGKRATLDRYVAPLTPQLIKKGQSLQEQPLVSKHPWKEKKKVFDVSLESIKEKLSKRNISSNVNNVVKLIGPLCNTAGWTCLKDGEVCSLNFSRLHETMLCRNLFQSFKLPIVSLNEPIPFNKSVIGENSWMLLLRMKREKMTGQNIHIVTDRRLTMSGFKVALYASSTNVEMMSHGEIIGMSNNVGFYGLNDLKEILSTLATTPSATVGQTRPLKLQFWLKGEAVRMVRSSPKTPLSEEVDKKLRMWRIIQQNLEGNMKTTWDEAKCLHDKPIFTSLYSLNDLPFSQSQTQRS